VSGASVADLDRTAVQRLLARLREREPGAFAGLPDEQALRRVGVVTEDAGLAAAGLVPTVGGLLALSQYPQQFFPQLNVTFVVVPATSKDTIPADGPRFLDNRTIGGPIPVMVAETVKAIVRNMATHARVTGVGREDSYDYPVEALREAVTNALMHRDYSPYARGTQVQVEMYSDRLVVRNPGGLFGTVTEDDLGQEGVSSSRNAVLARLLQDVALPGTDQVVCENRGTGIPSMIHALRRAGLTTPRFDDSLTRFRLTIPKHALLDADTPATTRMAARTRLAQIEALFDGSSTLTIGDVTASTGLKHAMASRYLARLVTEGRIVATAPSTSKRRAYRRP
jgi:ATP-dependent DNA helicase RecG